MNVAISCAKDAGESPDMTRKDDVRYIDNCEGVQTRGSSGSSSVTEPIKRFDCDRLCLESDGHSLCIMNESWSSNSVLVGNPDEGKLGGKGNGRGSSSLELRGYLCPSLWHACLTLDLVGDEGCAL